MSTARSSISIAAVVCAGLISAAAVAQQSIGGFAAGSDFEVLPQRQPTSSAPGTVEVAELFVYSCIHCYRLEPEIQTWRAEQPDHIRLVRIPVPFDQWRLLLAKAYYTAEALELIDEMHPAFFREIHEHGNLLQTEDELRAFFGRFGVDAEAFGKVFNSDEIAQKTARARELTLAYRVSSTPTLVVNGIYVSLQGAGDSHSQWFEIIDALTESEANRPAR